MFRHNEHFAVSENICKTSSDCKVPIIIDVIRKTQGTEPHYTYFCNSSLQADSEEFTGLPVINIETWLMHLFNPDILLNINSYFAFLYLDTYSPENCEFHYT